MNNNNNQEVFDIPTLGYTDWRKTMDKVIEFGIKYWKKRGSKEPMMFNFPLYVGTACQCLTFVAQFNNRLMLAGLQVDATWNRKTGKVEVLYA